MDTLWIARLLKTEIHLPQLRLRRPWMPCLILLALGGAGLAAWTYDARQAAPTHAAESQMTSAKVLQHVAPLIRTLEPETARWSLSTEQDEQSSMNVWHVSCTDERGAEVVRLLWNANLDRLVRMDVLPNCPLPKSSPVRNATQAIQAAENWLNALGFSANTPHWHLSAMSVQMGDHWVVNAIAGKKRVILGLYSATGVLQYVVFTPSHGHSI